MGSFSSFELAKTIIEFYFRGTLFGLLIQFWTHAMDLMGLIIIMTRNLRPPAQNLMSHWWAQMNPLCLWMHNLLYQIPHKLYIYIYQWMIHVWLLILLSMDCKCIHLYRIFLNPAIPTFIQAALIFKAIFIIMNFKVLLFL